MTRLILLDRDGVINHDSSDCIRDAGDWLPIPGSLEAIAALKRAGYLVAVCTNQAGVGRGLVSRAALERIHQRMHAALGGLGASLDGLRYCPHRPQDGCDCRKPRPGMLRAVMEDLGVPSTRTVFVGDALRDMEAAVAAGCRPVLVRTGQGAAAEAAARSFGVDCVTDDLAAFARHLIGHLPC